MNPKQTVTLLTILTLSVISISAQNDFTYRWVSTDSTETINGNPSMPFGAGHAPFADSVPFHAAYTVIAVYRSADDSSEGSVWRLGGADSLSRSLTTQRLVLGRASVRYDSVNRRGPVINCIMQSAPDTGERAPCHVPLTIGGSGGGLRIAELIYYPSRLGIGMLTRIQSLLAVRYGVTLGPVDYQTPDGKTLWRYGLDSAYHRRITGIAADSVCGLLQMSSRSGHDGAVLALSADSLPDGSYCLAGDDGGPLEFAWDDGDEYLQRTWKVRLTGSRAASVPYRLTFSTADFGGGDSLRLSVDGVMYAPSMASDSSVTFGGVSFQSDTALLRLARVAPLPDMKSLHGGVPAGSRGKMALVAGQTAVYPNPTTGSYSVSVRCVGSVQVAVRDMLGVTVATFSGEGREEYLFSGSLPTAGAYYVTVTTAEGSQTFRLAVK